MTFGVLSPQMQAAADGTVSELWTAFDTWKRAVNDARVFGASMEAEDVRSQLFEAQISAFESQTLTLDDSEYALWEKDTSKLLQTVLQATAVVVAKRNDAVGSGKRSSLFWGLGAMTAAVAAVAAMYRFRSGR
jgi:hypothetical protein